MTKYEHQLKVPYHLLFVPEQQERTLYRHTGEKYVSVKPNARGRCEMPELELEIGLQGGWMRFWFRDKLLPLPAELQGALEETRRQLSEERQAREAVEQELARLKTELEQRRQQGD
jgi:hypothetical protein